MSLIADKTRVPVSGTPTLSKQADTDRRREIFNDTHIAGVEKDFHDANHHCKNGRYALVVTPSSPILRMSNSSSVHVNMTGAGCESYMWLRNLYRVKCPEGMRVEFGYRTQHNAVCGDHLEDVFMLEVRIFVIGQPKKKRSHAR